MSVGAGVGADVEGCLSPRSHVERASASALSMRSVLPLPPSLFLSPPPTQTSGRGWSLPWPVPQTRSTAQGGCLDGDWIARGMWTIRRTMDGHGRASRPPTQEFDRLQGTGPPSKSPRPVWSNNPAHRRKTHSMHKGVMCRIPQRAEYARACLASKHAPPKKQTGRQTTNEWKSKWDERAPSAKQPHRRLLCAKRRRVKSAERRTTKNDNAHGAVQRWRATGAVECD